LVRSQMTGESIWSTPAVHLAGLGEWRRLHPAQEHDENARGLPWATTRGKQSVRQLSRCGDQLVAAVANFLWSYERQVSGVSGLPHGATSGIELPQAVHVTKELAEISAFELGYQALKVKK
jgi:hypothetical protein